jgi:hypothetical protein
VLKGILGKPWIDLSELADFSGFHKLHPHICRCFALAEHLVPHGMLYAPEDYLNLTVYENKFKMLFECYHEFSDLPDDHPIKINGKDLIDNDLVTYLKFALGGYDLYSFYVLCDFKDGWRATPEMISREPIADYFPEVMKWINSLIDQKVFSHIGRATFFVQDSGGMSFEHFDESVDPNYPEITSEFVHLRQTLNRPFYVRDQETLEKTYIDSKVAYWNDQDFHGGDPVLIPTYSFRIDGVFTEEFRNKILDQHS